MISKIEDITLLQRIFESSVEGIIVLNNKGDIQTANTASEQIFGYEKGELISKNIELLIPNGFKRIYKAHKKIDAKNLVTKAKNIDEDLWGIKKNGTKFNLDISLSQAINQDEKTTLVFLRNCSKRKEDINKINEKFKETNRKFDALINNLKGIAYRCKNNKNWEMLYISKGCLDVTGYDYTVFKEHKKHYGEIIIEEDRDMVWNKIQRAIHRKKTYSLEYRIRNSDGQIKYVWEKGEAVYNEKNEVIALEGFISDITKQKQVELELKASEAKNKAILEALPDHIVIHNTDGAILDALSVDTLLENYSMEEVIGKNLQEFVSDEEDRDRVLNTFSRVAKSQKMEIFELEVPSPNRTILYEVRAVPFEKDKVLVVARDITDSKETESRLLESEAKISALLRTLPDLMIVYDRYGNHLEVHAPANFQLAAPYDDHIGQNIDAILPKKVCEIIRRGFADFEKTKETQTVEFSFMAEGELRHFESRIIQTDEGNFLTIIRDVTSQKEAEEILKKNENRLRDYAVTLEEKVQERTKELKATVQQLVESNLSLEDQAQVTKKAESKLLVSQIMFSAIAKNFPRGMIIVANAHFEIEYAEGEELEKMGLRDLALPGINIDEMEIFSKSRKTRLKQDIRKTLTGEHLSFEIEFKNNTYSVNSTPLYDDHEKVIQALLVYSNISQQKKVERGIQEALEKEQELNELKSRFIAMASHEFRTPLTAILSSAILIGKQNQPGKEEKREKYVAQVKKNVKNLVNILNDFLSLSKLEEGKVEAKFEFFDIIDFSKTVIQEITPTLKKGQVIKLKNDHSSINVYLDSKLTHHILTNLLSNAIKYSPESKEITMKVSSKATQLCIEVTDQGIGIPIEEQQNMFKRFYRAQNATNFEGTGLGLNIIKQYTELMNGTVSLKSKLNEGATFIVELPMNQK